MSTCTVANSSSIYCEDGCCGTVQDRICCEYALSEEIIIVICVVGALFVIAVVVALIICLTSNNKDRVTPIRQPRRRNQNENAHPRQRREVYPMPPPYSEAPPTYESLETPVDLRPSPSSTDPILPGTVDHHRTNVRQSRRQHRNNRRGRNVVGIEHPTDAPPPYVSIVNVDQTFTQTARYSTGPSTSGDTPVQRSRDNEIGTPSIEVIDRTGRGSPHPSLASGDISMANDNDRSHRLHRTVSERSQFMTPFPTVGRMALRAVDSVTPVTIREITVHSQFMHNIDSASEREQARNENFQHRKNMERTTKIPRPIQRVRANDEQQNNQSRDPTPNIRKIHISPLETGLGETSRSVASKTNSRQININESVSNKRVKKESSFIDMPANVLGTNTKRHRSQTITQADDDELLENLSTNLKPSAAARREQRRTILVRLRDRRQNASSIDLE